MNVRFHCPACDGHHVFDMPETTIHMTCSATHRTLELRLTPGGDVKARVLDETSALPAPAADASTDES